MHRTSKTSARTSPREDSLVTSVMWLNLGSGPGPILDDTYTHFDHSFGLLLTKLWFPQKFISYFSGQNIAWEKSVKYRDLRKLNLPHGTVKFTYSSHLLEHLYYNDAVILISKIYDAMMEGGFFRLALPDYDFYIKNYIETLSSNPIAAYQKYESQLLSYPAERPNFRKKVRGFIVGDLHTHKWHPTYAIVELLLIEAGFKNIKRCIFRDSNLPNISAVENRSDETFYVEAER